tara:strand:- start:267 stop:524 length:258 start_codon:yes stop_codon:yes gene_type:complete
MVKDTFRKKLKKHMKEQGMITTDERLEVLKQKMEDKNTPIKIRFRCISLLQTALDGSKYDIEEWFKELIALTDDVIRSTQYVQKR